MGKGRAERELLTLPAEAKKAIERWLGLSTHRRLWRLITKLVEHVSVKARPHGLQHTAVTEALHVFSGDYRKVRAFSRHSSLDIVRRYDDNRADHGAQVSAALGPDCGLSHRAEFPFKSNGIVS